MGRTDASLMLVLVTSLAGFGAAPALAQEVPATFLISRNDGTALTPFTGGGAGASFAGITPDGTHAYFETKQNYASEGDTDDDPNHSVDGWVDVYERVGNQTTLISTPGNGNFDADFLAVSDDGERVFFRTKEPMVDDSDTAYDIYMRFDGDTTNISGGTANTDAVFGGISADGTKVFWNTTEPITGDDTDVVGFPQNDVFQWSGGTRTRISTGANGGNDPCHASFSGTDEDASHVFFSTQESIETTDVDDPDCHQSLVDDGTLDIYDRQSGTTTTLVSPGNVGGGSSGGFGDTFKHSSDNGDRVTWQSDLPAAPDDTTPNGHSDCLDDVYQRFGGNTLMISKAPTDSQSTACNTGVGYFTSSFKFASDDGTRVFWKTDQPLSDGDAEDDGFMTFNGAVTLITTGTPTADADISGITPDGTKAYFGTTNQAGDGDTDSASDVFEYDGGVIRRISRGPAGGNGPNGASFQAVSEDGERVIFGTSEKLHDDDLDTSGPDIYKRENDETTLVSTGPMAGTQNFGAIYEDASEDAERVFFTTNEKLLQEDNDQAIDLYMRYRTSITPSFSETRVNEVALDDQFVELKSSGPQTYPDEDAPYKVVVYDANATEVGEHTIDVDLLRSNDGTPPLLLSDTVAGADEELGVTLPAIGQVCFTSGAAEEKVSCIRWGCVVTPVDDEATHVPAPPAGQSVQRQGIGTSVFELAAPTPGDENDEGDTATPCPANGGDGNGNGDGDGDGDGNGGGGGGPDGGGAPLPLGPGPGGVIQVPDVIAPAFTGRVRATNTTFAVDARSRAERSVRAAAAKKGTTFVFSLSEAARVVFAVERRTKRRRRTVYKAFGAFAVDGKQGSNRKAFSGKIARKTMSPGKYRVRMVATDAAGNTSRPRTVNVTVVRR